jgi:predicted dehydrogenase
MVGFQRRFDEQFLAAREFMQRLVTPPSTIVVHAADPVNDLRDTQTDSAFLKHIISNSVVHDIDILAWIVPITRQV